MTAPAPPLADQFPIGGVRFAGGRTWHRLRHRYNVRVSLDDRDRVVALWRRMGLPTWQVNYGNF